MRTELIRNYGAGVVMGLWGQEDLSEQIYVVVLQQSIQTMLSTRTRR
jgi:hypothetical protein